MAGFYALISLSTYLLNLGSYFQVMWLTPSNKVKFRKEHSQFSLFTEVSQSCERRWHQSFDSEFWDPGRKGRQWKRRKLGWQMSESHWVKEGRNVAFNYTSSPTPALPWRWQQISKAHGEGRTWLQCNKMAKELISEWFGESYCRKFFKTSLPLKW